MQEEFENSAVDEVATPQDTSEHVAIENQANEAPIESKQDRNWREMSRKQQQLENELRSQREMNEKLIHLQLSQQQQHIKAEPDELDILDDAEFLPKGQVKKLVEKEKAKIVQAAIEEMETRARKRDEGQFLQKLKAQYSDFDDVVNTDTMALLEQTDPELAATIVDLKDPYKIGVQTYKYIKAMNLASQVPNSRRAKEVERKLEANSKTVQTPQAYDKRPMAQAFKMTESEKDNLYREMMGYASGSGYGY